MNTETRTMEASTAGIILAWFCGEALRWGDVVATEVAPVITNIRAGWTYRLYGPTIRSHTMMTDDPAEGAEWIAAMDYRNKVHEDRQAESDAFEARVQSGEVERPLSGTGRPYPRYYRKESLYVDARHLADITMSREAWTAWDENVERRDMPCLYYP